MRRSLVLLATAGLLPIVALGATFGTVTLRAQRQEMRQQARTSADFAAALIALKLADGETAIDMVAQSRAFENGFDRERFGITAAKAVAGQPDWRTISVADPTGWRLLDVPVAIGGRQAGPVMEPASLRRVVATRRPAIGDVVSRRGITSFAIRAPVLTGGRVRYVVSAIVTAERLRQLLLFQAPRPGWRIALLDAAGHVVAQSRAANGDAMLATDTHIRATGWTVRVEMPERALQGARRAAILLLALAGILCLLLVALLARLLATELRQLRRAEAVELQSQRMEALGRMTGGIAHDFNNLLTPILGGLDMIGRHPGVDERTKRHADRALAAAQRARALVARLLAFARRQQLAPKPIDLAALLEGMAELIDHSLPPGIETRRAVVAELPPTYADPAQLELAVLNLAVNARDAMPSGGLIRIAADRASDAQAAGLPPGAYLAIAVADDGTGMDASTLAQAIDPFFTTKPIARGTGLGLSMVHGFAAQSGGALRLESRPGAGTVATIVLPQSPAPVEAEEGATGDARLPAGRILLVDDGELVRGAAADILREAGQEVVEAGDVEEAIAYFRAGEAFDAVVTDFLMPGRSGGELIRLLRQNRPKLPILLITGYTTRAEDVPPSVELLAKPFDARTLIAALARVRRSPVVEHAAPSDG